MYNDKQAKMDVLSDIGNWADGLALERVKSRKQAAQQPPAAMERPAEQEAAPPADQDDAGELSLEDIMNLTREYEGQ